MCEFISLFHNPATGQVKVWDLESHGNTEEHLKLDHHWREGHYLPSGEIELRFAPLDNVDQEKCKYNFQKKYPTFVDFFNWCQTQGICTLEVLNLYGLTSAKGLTIPTGVKELYLYSLKSAKWLTIPKGVKYLWLNSLTSAVGLVVPEGVKEFSLNSLESAKDLMIPKEVKVLSLNSLTSAVGLVVPEGVKVLYLNSLSQKERQRIKDKFKVKYVY